MNAPLRIAVLGLGAMGSRIAARLGDAGHQLAVWNRTAAAAVPFRARDARVAETPAVAARDADVVLAVLRDDEASRAVWLEPGRGALAAMRPGAVAVEVSTLSPAWIREWHAAAATRGLYSLDAPVVGSRPQAEAGQLIVLAGGTTDAAERALPALRTFAAAVHHGGAAGTGAVLKLAANALFGIQVAALAEWLGTARRAGLEPALVARVLGELPVASPAAKGALASMVAGQFAPSFPVELAEKDFGYAEALAGGEERGPLTAAARRVLRAAVARGFGEEHLTSVVRLYGD